MYRATWALQLVLIFFSLLGCSDRAPVPSLAPLATDARILAFGDSLTYGTGAERDQSYPSVLQGLSGRTVINAGIPGETSTQGAQRLAEVIDETQPDLVILCLGGNDMLRKLDRAAMKRSLAQMISLIREQGIQLVLLGVPEPALLSLKSEPVYEELATEFDIALEKTIIPEVLGDQARKSDQIHPNAQGYADMAKAIHALLNQAGAL